MSAAPETADPTHTSVVDTDTFSPRGLRAYIAHPDHVLLAIVVAAAGLYLRNWNALATGLGVVIVGSFVLAWLDDYTGEQRHGAAWTAYRQQVAWWWPRWKPWHRTLHDATLPPARAYFAETCLTCSAVCRWVRAREPVGLAIHAAEDHPRETLGRMSYDPMDGAPEERGLTGFARVLEHLNFFYALIGFAARLPVISLIAQVVVDALGGGPRIIPRRGARSKP